MTKLEEWHRAASLLKAVSGTRREKEAQRQLEAIERDFTRPAFASLCVPQRA